jgi:hypothetical protein
MLRQAVFHLILIPMTLAFGLAVAPRATLRWLGWFIALNLLLAACVLALAAPHRAGEPAARDAAIARRRLRRPLGLASTSLWRHRRRAAPCGAAADVGTTPARLAPSSCVASAASRATGGPDIMAAAPRRRGGGGPPTGHVPTWLGRRSSPRNAGARISLKTGDGAQPPWPWPRRKQPLTVKKLS